jgi:hypothetical protein
LPTTKTFEVPNCAGQFSASQTLEEAMKAEGDGETKLALVLGGTGKNRSPLVSRLEQRGFFVRRGSRSGEPPFDWAASNTWEPALDGVGAV